MACKDIQGKVLWIMSGIFANSDIKTGGVKRRIEGLTGKLYGFADLRLTMYAKWWSHIRAKILAEASDCERTWRGEFVNFAVGVACDVS